MGNTRGYNQPTVTTRIERWGYARERWLDEYTKKPEKLIKKIMSQLKELHDHLAQYYYYPKYLLGCWVL